MFPSEREEALTPGLAVPLLISTLENSTPGDVYNNDCNSKNVKWAKRVSIAEWINCDIIT